MEVYPNPADYELTVEEGEITLSGGQQPGQVFSVELYDAVGKRVRDGSSRNGKITLPVSQLPTGVYTLRGTEAGGQSFTRRVMLVR